MKPRFVICALVLVLVILAVVFWQRLVQHTTLSEPRREAAHPTNSPLENASVTSQSVPNVISPTTITPVNSKPSTANDIRTPQGFQRYVEEHNVQIDFYGQIIDQDSNALSGATIEVSIRHWTMPDPIVLLAGSKEIYVEQNSDANGRFEIHGEKGDGVYIESIQKSGYELEPGQRNYGTVNGSFESPVMIKMWSTNIHEQLVTGEKKFQIVPDGRPYVIDLSKGTIAESGGGDLKAWIKYAAPATRGQLSDWSCELDVINGGLLEQPLGSAMFSAPAEGYVPAFQSLQQIKGGQRGSSGEHLFYVRLKNGQEYGRIAIGFYAPFNNQTPGLIRLSYAINPSGSRILR